MSRPLDIAILAHSTNPRGGVVHALELGDALTRLGHRATVHAPDATGGGFFRPTLCATISVAASPIRRGTTLDMVEPRIADYVRHFEVPAHRRFDVFHAQDGISANALATLRYRGLIPGFARTVHHLDTFPNSRLQALQDRSIDTADELLVVSAVGAEELRARHGRTADIVGNGVDRTRFTALTSLHDELVARRYALPRSGPLFLAIGGIEARKNTLHILAAFTQVHRSTPEAVLVIAGGASLLDHSGYHTRFREALAASGLPETAVRILGPVPDDDMPSLYRLATALVFPSVQEGFGLVVLEAMASGTPTVTSRIEPFTSYLGADDVIWCDPVDTRSIADAMRQSLTSKARASLSARGQIVAARHDWHHVAEAHLPTYRRLLEPAHA
jgi:glycosyltransferase-like protein